MRAMCGCPAMFTLLLLSCVAAAAAGPLWESPLAPGCGGKDCDLSASQSVHHTSATLPPAKEGASLNHRSDNTVSAPPPATSDTAKMLNGRSLQRGETSAASHHPAPSTSDVFSGQHLFNKFEAYFSGKRAEELRAKHVIDVPTTKSSGLSQRRNNDRQHSKDVLINQLYAGITLNGRHSSEQPGYGSNSKLKKETPALLSNNPYNRQSGAVLHRPWKGHNSLATKGEVSQTVKGRVLTLTPVSDDVVSLGHGAAPKAEHADGESAGKSRIAPLKGNVPSSAQPIAVPLQWYRSNSEGLLSRDYRPSGTPDTRERMHQDVTTASNSEGTGTDPATLPSSASEVVPADGGDSVIIQTPDPDLEEQKEEIEEAIARDATLIIVFSCLAVASLVMWRIVRCIAMHKLKKHEKRLAAHKVSSVFSVTDLSANSNI